MHIDARKGARAREWRKGIVTGASCLERTHTNEVHDGDDCRVIEALDAKCARHIRP